MCLGVMKDAEKKVVRKEYLFFINVFFVVYYFFPPFSVDLLAPPSTSSRIAHSQSQTNTNKIIFHKTKLINK